MRPTLGLSNIERQRQLLRFIETQRRVTIHDISSQFAISLATARRDLTVLTDQGMVHRVYGGAIASRQVLPEPPVLRRSQVCLEEKKRIGSAAAHLVNEGDTVFLGSGTTVLEVARNLKDRQHLTVITNSILVINELADIPSITMVTLGGIMRSSELSLIGHLAERSLAEVRADKVFIGIHAIDVKQGLTNDYLPETMTDRAIIRIGRQVILVADHTKCGSVSTAFVAPVSAIHTFITDTEAPVEFVSALRKRGVQVLVV